jgi:hypothetical protein
VTLRELMRLPDVPELPSVPQAGTPLTGKLVYVIADGLRYDFAIDPAFAPNVARRMKQHTHGELRAGRVTMTSAALLAMSTGQRGDFAEVITNLKAGRTRFDDIVNSARRAGLSTGLVGDATWAQMVGAFEQEVLDDSAMAIDVDNSPLMFEVAHGLIDAGRLANFQIIHFIATDHQGHAYGTASQRYAAFLLKFDADLEKMLASLPADATVMFMSDHGATDTGAHGSDIASVRRSPLFAYGPGVRKGVDLGVVDQVDLGPTIAALLGVPAPKHARGTVVTELLDVPPQRAAALACSDAHRATDYAKAIDLRETVQAMQQEQSPCTLATATPQARIDGSRKAVRTFDRALDDTQSTRGLRGAVLIGAALALLGGLFPLLARKMLPDRHPMRSWAWSVGSLLMCALCVVLTLYVERIPSPWHNVVRAVLFTGSGIALLIGLLRPNVAVRWYERAPELAWVLLPGALACSYTTNTQALAWIVLAAVVVLVAFGLDAESRGGWLAGARRHASCGDLALIAASVAFLVPFGFRTSEPLPAWLGSHPGPLLIIDLAAIALWVSFVWRKSANARWWQAVGAIVMAAGCLALRRVAPAWMGVGGTFLLPVLGVLAFARRLPLLGIGAGLGAWAWVSRDEEVLPLLACLAVAEAAGRVLAARTRHESGEPAAEPMSSSVWVTALAVTLLLCITFLARIGLQRGLDFTTMDFGAGSFGDPHASALRITSSLVWKYVAADLLLLAVFLRNASGFDRRMVLLMFSGVAALRAMTIALMLFVCRTSYWTGYRTLSDEGPALSLVVAGALLIGLTSLLSPGQSSEGVGGRRSP